MHETPELIVSLDEEQSAPSPIACLENLGKVFWYNNNPYMCVRSRGFSEPKFQWTNLSTGTIASLRTELGFADVPFLKRPKPVNIIITVMEVED